MTSAVPINSKLEPKWLKMKAGESRFQMLGNFSSMDDPWSEIRTAHSQQCVFRPEIHRTLIAVAEKEDANQADGIALVRLSWDGDVTGVEEADPPLEPEFEIIAKVSAAEALHKLDATET
ncbi:hypothetical protein NX059_012084 [Plenodomus lindquistii]|nr:hypothetical protein NX059_012084 [Plenodomus lindquistii]